MIKLGGEEIIRLMKFCIRDVIKPRAFFLFQKYFLFFLIYFKNYFILSTGSSSERISRLIVMAAEAQYFHHIFF